MNKKSNDLLEATAGEKSFFFHSTYFNFPLNFVAFNIEVLNGNLYVNNYVCTILS